VDASHYIDPIGRRVLGFDHIKQQIIPDDIEDLPPVDNKDLESERYGVQLPYRGKRRRKVVLTHRIFVLFNSAQLQKNLQSYIQFEYMHQYVLGSILLQSETLLTLSLSL
jgi:hypothetical protein